MARNKRFLGLQYPLVSTPRGTFAQKNGIDQIKADLLQLLLTHPGERVMLPDFGIALRDLLFDPNDAALEIEARRMIFEAIQKWEPRVVISLENIYVSSVPTDDDLNPDDPKDQSDHVLSIKIRFFDPENIDEVHELRLERPLGGV
jgi:phage baseplate assembly protein W